MIRLYPPKTRTETGLDHVLTSINLLTPYGKKQAKEVKPYLPGQENELEQELDRVERLIGLFKDHLDRVETLLEVFHDMKEISHTVARSAQNALTVVELFELKSFLLQCEKIRETLAPAADLLPEEFHLLPTVDLLDQLDPQKDRINTFYLYDEFSERLSALRKEKRELELAIRQEKKEIRAQLQENCQILLTPKFDLAVSKSNAELLSLCRSLPELVQESEDYMTAIFQIRGSQTMDDMTRRMEELVDAMEEEELLIRERLSHSVHLTSGQLLTNCQRLGALDYCLAKAVHAHHHECIRPEILTEHRISFEEGRHLLVEDLVKSKGKRYCPVSLTLHDGVSCITGANMGGKTVSLKLIGLMALLTQYGFFVPARKAQIGLSSYVHLLIGDIQSMQRGLSSFGGEMEELKDILDHSISRSLLLIDEIASGTNPVEGLALTRSIIDYLNQKPYITVITTHFDHAAVDQSVQNLQVRGLASADMKKLIRELQSASRRERIEVISRYMDYRLVPVSNQEEIPKDALNIAKMLGINDEIINQARKYMNPGGTE